MILRVAILQHPIIWANKSENIQRTIRRIRRLKGKADVALLPEMFSTGFVVDRPELAESIDGITISTLQQTADETGIAIAGSFICEEITPTQLNGAQQEQTALYNRGFFLRPNASPYFVDKAHLYPRAGENHLFTAGKERPIIEYKGVKIRMLICYDLRFPVWARNESGFDYDILLIPANWPESRIQYWDCMLASRATENQCYIAACNPVGDDIYGNHYNGHSIAYDTRLNPLVRFRNNEAGTKVANFDIDTLMHFRKVSPLWKDADKFVIL